MLYTNPTLAAEGGEILNGLTETVTVAVNGATRITDLSIEAARKGLARGATRVQSTRDIRDAGDFVKWQESAQRAEAEEFGDLARRGAEIVAETQREFIRISEKTRKDWSKNMDAAVDKFFPAAPDAEANPYAEPARRALKNFSDACESAAEFSRQAFESGVEGALSTLNGASRTAESAKGNGTAKPRRAK